MLLVDDTMTTGAKLQSAASALNLGGARVVAAVVLGRVIDVRDPNNPEKLELGSGSARSGLTSTSAASSDAKGRATSRTPGRFPRPGPGSRYASGSPPASCPAHRRCERG
jgi:hypothetical protein